MGQHVLHTKLGSRMGAEKSVFDLGMYPGMSMSVECGGLYIWKGVEGKDGAIATFGKVGLET